MSIRSRTALPILGAIAPLVLWASAAFEYDRLDCKSDMDEIRDNCYVDVLEDYLLDKIECEVYMPDWVDECILEAEEAADAAQDQCNEQYQDDSDHCDDIF